MTDNPMESEERDALEYNAVYLESGVTEQFVYMELVKIGGSIGFRVGDEKHDAWTSFAQPYANQVLVAFPRVETPTEELRKEAILYTEVDTMLTQIRTGLQEQILTVKKQRELIEEQIKLTEATNKLKQLEEKGASF